MFKIRAKQPGWNRPPVMEPDGEADLLEVAMGAASSLTCWRLPHGCRSRWRAGDPAPPVFDLHRNHEKLGEGMSYLASMPFTDRLDYMCPPDQ